MKSIKVKVKTLLILGLLSIFGLVYSEQIYNAAESLIPKIGDGQDKAYLALDPTTLKGENTRLEMILEKHDYELYNLVTLGQGMSSISSRIRHQDAINVYASYENFKKEALKEENYHYMINVALVQWFGGLVEKTEKVLEDMPLSQLDQESKDHYHLLKAMMALTFHDLETVVNELDQVSETYEQTVNATRAYMANIFKYDIDYQDLKKDPLEGDFTSYLQEIITGVNEYLLQSSYRDVYGQDLTLKGRVTMDGEPIAGAMVYAKGYKGMSSMEGYSKDMTVTDDQGYYTLASKDQMKGLGIKLPWHLVQDKRIESQWHMDYTQDQSFDFEFESGIYFNKAVIEDGYFVYEIEDQKEGQAYILNISHADPSFVNDNSHYRLTEKKGRIPLDDIHRATRFRFGWMGSTDPFNIKMLTEPLYLTGDYYFSVDRVNSHSTYSTNGIFSDRLKTLISYEGVDYNQGDVLIKEGKIDEAIKWYEENPSRHNLKVLIALYTHGRKAKEGEYEQVLYDRDLDKAIHYSKMLIDLDGVTNDRLSSLASLYKDQKNYEEETKILKQVIEENDSIYHYLSLARSTVNSGQYMAGVDMYINHGDMASQGDRYYSIFILGDQLEYLPDEIKDNLLIKDRTDFQGFFRDIQLGNYEAAYDQIMDLKDSPMKRFYHLLFMDAFDFEFIDYPFEVGESLYYRSGFLDYYVETTKTIGDKEFKSILMFMKERNNWF